MDVEAEIERARAAEPAWDELRERRVLARVAAERTARARRRERARLAGAALAGLAVAAAVALIWSVASGGEEVPVAQQREDASGSSLVLSDGSEVRLEQGARVEIVAQSASELRLAQREGGASYDVSHRPERAFVVAVDDVEVRVRGTRFSVRVDGPWAEVEVREGRVEVAGGGDVRALGAGEALRVQRHHEVTASATTTAESAETIVVPVEIIATAEPSAAETPTEATPIAIAEPEPERATTARRAPPASLDALLAEADAARRDGRVDDAAEVLRRAAREHARDPRVATALFTLGRLERTRGRAAAAARAFEDAYQRDPDAVLAEDALAEAAAAWRASGDGARAAETARRYVDRYPDGEYAARVRPLIE